MTLWYLAPILFFGLVYTVCVEIWGRRWLVCICATILLAIGCAVMLPLKECQPATEESDCLWSFAPYFLVGLGQAFTNTILLSMLPYIAHPNVLGTAIGLILTITVIAQTIYMEIEGSDQALVNW